MIFKVVEGLVLHILQENSTKKILHFANISIHYYILQYKNGAFYATLYHISSNQVLIKNFKTLKSPNHVHKIIKKNTHSQKININGMKTSHVKK